MPRLDRRTKRVLSGVLSVVVVLLVWWVQSQGSEDSGRTAGEAPTAPSSSSASSPSSATSHSPSASARPSATAETSRTTAANRMPEADRDGFAYVALDDLPVQAAETVELIDDGGPFPYPDKDGSTFGNFEGVLPDRQRGYYAEYTVETPGLSHRGARRIIGGDGGELYWTEDHYESFERIWR